jgi:hypothetical protein
MRDRPLVVNATAIGPRVDGIAVYGVNLVKALWRAGGDRPLTVVLNEDARRFFPESEIPAGASIRWVSARMSPSRGTRGNLRRWVFANHLARQYRDALVFGLSQRLLRHLQRRVERDRRRLLVLHAAHPRSITSSVTTSDGRHRALAVSRRPERRGRTCAATTD